MSSNTVRIRRLIFKLDTSDEDGEIEKGSDGGSTTHDGGCVSDRE